MSYPIMPNGKLTIQEIDVIRKLVKENKSGKFPQLEEMISKVEYMENKNYKYDVYWSID